MADLSCLSNNNNNNNNNNSNNNNFDYGGYDSHFREATFCCPLCSEFFPKYALIAHTPQCYIPFCLKLKIAPLCTCPNCNGTRAHPIGNYTSGPGPISPPSPLSPPFIGSPFPPVAAPPSVKREREDCVDPQEVDPPAKRTPEQQMGKSCCMCGVKRQPASSHIPAVHVGKFRRYILCKKEHLIDKEKCTEFTHLVEFEAKRVEKWGDSPISVLNDGSEEEEAPKKPEKTYQCEGYTSLEDKEKCNNPSSYLWIEGFGNQIKYFCRATHLVRYMVVQYTAHGGGNGKKKGGKKESKVFTDKILSLDNSQFQELIGIPKDATLEFIKKYEISQSGKGSGRRPLMSPADELIISLLHLRHYPVSVLMATIFDTSKQTLVNSRDRGLNFLYHLMQSNISLRTHDERLESSVMFFDHNITFIVDGSEQFVKRPNNPLTDTLFYSVKKGHHTINKLIVISIDKKILYLSPSYPGSVNDMQIILETKQEWYSHFQSDEYGFGDHGMDGLDDYDLQISTPPGYRYIPVYKLVSKIRTKVENVLADMKDWK